MPGSNNTVAIDLICTHIRQKLQERSNMFRQKIAIPHRYLPSSSGASTPESRCEDLDLNLTVHPQTNQLKVCLKKSSPRGPSILIYLVSQGIFTILRNKNTSKQDFVFFTDRLSTLLVEHALQLLPHVPKTVMTPTGAEAHGQKIDAQVSTNPSC